MLKVGEVGDRGAAAFSVQVRRRYRCFGERL